jgi:hypothetical protein
MLLGAVPACLTLALFVSRVLADDANNSLALDHAAVLAETFN